MDNRPIGVFDSGIGGLTVLREIMELNPSESLVYFGDNGRAPYGVKSEDTVVKFTFQDIRFLLNHDIKMIVIACNTISACSLDQVKNSFDIPVIEVVQPGARAAMRETHNKRIGVIGTRATIRSGVYERAISSLDRDVQIFSNACPLFVNLVEEGWWNKDVAYSIAKEYLTPLMEKEIDTLVLGCTHYPILSEVISKVTGDGVRLVSSATEVAKVVKTKLEQENTGRVLSTNPEHRFFTSDSVEMFEQLGSFILGKSLCAAQKVDIEKY